MPSDKKESKSKSEKKSSKSDKKSKSSSERKDSATKSDKKEKKSSRKASESTDREASSSRKSSSAAGESLSKASRSGSGSLSKASGGSVSKGSTVESVKKSKSHGSSLGRVEGAAVKDKTSAHGSGSRRSSVGAHGGSGRASQPRLRPALSKEVMASADAAVETPDLDLRGASPKSLLKLERKSSVLKSPENSNRSLAEPAAAKSPSPKANMRKVVSGKDSVTRRRALARIDSIVRPAESGAEILAELDHWAVIHEVLADAYRVAELGSADATLSTSTDGVVQSGYAGANMADTMTLNGGLPERELLLGQHLNNDPSAVADMLRRQAQKSGEMKGIRKEIKELNTEVKKAQILFTKRHDQTKKRLQQAQNIKLQTFIKKCAAEYRNLERSLNLAAKPVGKINRTLILDKDSSPKFDQNPKAVELGLLAPKTLALVNCWFESGIQSQFEPLKYANDGGNFKRWQSLQAHPGVNEQNPFYRYRLNAFEFHSFFSDNDEIRMEAATQLSDLRLQHEKELHDLERQQMVQMTDQWLDNTLSDQERGLILLICAHKLLVRAMLCAQKLAEGYLENTIHERQILGLQKKIQADRRNAKKEVSERKRDMKRAHQLDLKKAARLPKGDKRRLEARQKQQLEAFEEEYLAQLERKEDERRLRLAKKHDNQRATLTLSHRRFVTRKVRRLCSMQRRLSRKQADSNRSSLQNAYDDAQKLVAELQADEAAMLRDEQVELTSLANQLRNHSIADLQKTFSDILREWAQSTARSQTGAKSRSVLDVITGKQSEVEKVASDLAQTSFAELTADGKGTISKNTARERAALSKGGLVDYSTFIHDTVRQGVQAYGIRALRRAALNTISKQQRELEVWTEHRQQRLDFEDKWFAVFKHAADHAKKEADKLSRSQWTWLQAIDLAERKASQASAEDAESISALMRQKFGIRKSELAPKVASVEGMAERHARFTKSIEGQWDLVKEALQHRWKRERQHDDNAITQLITGQAPTADSSTTSSPAAANPGRSGRLARRRSGSESTGSGDKRKRTIRRTVSKKVMKKKLVKRKTKVHRKGRSVTKELDSDIICQCEAFHAYTATKPDQMSIRVGDIINVTRQKASGWWEGRMKGGRTFGKFPSNFVRVLDDESRDSETSEDVEIDVESMTDTEEEVELSASASSSFSVTPADSEDEKDAAKDLVKAPPMTFKTFSKISPDVLKMAQASYAAEKAAEAAARANGDAGGVRSATANPRTFMKGTWKPPTQIARETRKAQQVDNSKVPEMIEEYSRVLFATTAGEMRWLQNGNDSDSDGESSKPEVAPLKFKHSTSLTAREASHKNDEKKAVPRGPVLSRRARKVETAGQSSSEDEPSSRSSLLSDSDEVDESLISQAAQAIAKPVEKKPATEKKSTKSTPTTAPAVAAAPQKPVEPPVAPASPRFDDVDGSSEEEPSFSDVSSDGTLTPSSVSKSTESESEPDSQSDDESASLSSSFESMDDDVLDVPVEDEDQLDALLEMQLKEALGSDDESTHSGSDAKNRIEGFAELQMQLSKLG